MGNSEGKQMRKGNRNITGIAIAAFVLAASCSMFGDIDDLRQEAAEVNKIPYKVAFNLNGGSGNTPSGVEVPRGSSITLPGDAGFYNLGFDFVCWNDKADGGGTNYNAGTSFTPSASLTLYAMWEALEVNTRSIKYIANEADSPSTVPETQYVAMGSTNDRPDNPVRNGYKFDGWYILGTDNLWLFNTTPVDENVVLSARWEGPLSGQYTVRFIRNGGTPFIDDISVNHGALLSGVPTISKTGSTFGGWFRDIDCETEPWLLNDDTVNSSTTITLYALWNNPSYYTVNFISNGGTAVPQQIVAVAESVEDPEINGMVEKDGYVLDGWYQESGFTIKWNFVNHLIGGNLNLFAKWISVEDWYKAVILGLTGGGESSPADLAVDFRLTDANWRGIIAAIGGAGKFINLDLSACARSDSSTGGGLRSDGTFDPIPGVSGGKDKIVNIALPDAAESIVDGNSSTSAFKSFACLKSFSGEGLGSIGNYAFYGLTSLNMTALPSGITSIGSGAFSGCTYLALTSLPAGLSSIEDWTFDGCTKLALDSLPAGIKTIDVYAFSDCENLALTELPSGLDTIRARVFSGCTKLALGSLPTGITLIEEYAFIDCENITLKTLPAGITGIGEGAFQGCTKLALTALPEGVNYIYDYTFSGCENLALTSLPTGLKTIGFSAFWCCTNLALTTLPSGLTSIDPFAFDGCTNLALTELPSGLTTIGVRAFSMCPNIAITELEFPATLTVIEEGIFSGSSAKFTSITLHAGITRIDDEAFLGCNSLQLVTCLRTTPPNLVSGAFADGASVWEIKVPAASVSAYQTAAGWSYYADRIRANLLTAASQIGTYLATQSAGGAASNPVYLPVGLQLTSTNWTNILNAINTGAKYVDLDLSFCTNSGSNSGGGLRLDGTFDPVYNLSGNAQTGKGRIVSIILPDEATSIVTGAALNMSAFLNFSNLARAEGRNVTDIRRGAFYQRNNLTSVNFPVTKNIYSSAFDRSGLVSASFPMVTNISESAFFYCKDLATICFPATASFDIYSFVGCTSLTFDLTEKGPDTLNTMFDNKALVRNNNTELVLYPSAEGDLTITAPITRIGDYAFCDAVGLSSINSSTVTSIGENAFEWCSNLVNASFPALKSISDYTFINCGSLESVYIPAATNIGYFVFGMDLSYPEYAATDLTITLGSTVPNIGFNNLCWNDFDYPENKKVIVKVPSGATGYGPVPYTCSDIDNTVNWGNGFRGAGWNGTGFVNTNAWINNYITLYIEEYTP